ncbi:two-component system regulatory protein YycI [Alicyclobacillus ferrooxydans]|uniref:Regulatory protein YycH-like domain-containing protein n=1 Tax=Alicyclobacillus ferrooxydans TaxID=471514 RepID=A0A0P9EU66_9BACL|nr:two-component system regulatory protein YycI [Alicyclobacillus ferrooxydans]KPV42486.1 hypothetical protein AN477_17160 [Alicyclobacillus ferrooxydans]
MKWEFAKTWLIVAFLFLDCILGWQVYTQRQAQVAYVESYSDLLANTKTLLSEHGLSLDTTVPQSHTPMSVLKGSFAQPSLNQLVASSFPGATQVHIDTTAGDAKLPSGTIQITDLGSWSVNYSAPILRNYKTPNDILKIVWKGSQYVPDNVTSGQATDKSGLKQYNFIQKYQSYLIFDASVVVEANSSSVASFQQTAVTNLQTVGNAKPTISALDALDSLANSVDQMMANPGGQILSIQLGYAQKVAGDTAPDTSNPSANYWFPVWRIVTKGTVYFVNAFTGEVNVPLK